MVFSGTVRPLRFVVGVTPSQTAASAGVAQRGGGGFLEETTITHETYEPNATRDVTDSVEPFGAPPGVVAEQDSAQLGELGRRVFQRREQEGALVDGERDQLDAATPGSEEGRARLRLLPIPNSPAQRKDATPR